MNPSDHQRPDRLDGRVGRVTFRNPENGFTVLRLEQEGGARVAVVGSFPELREGQTARFFGRWTEHARYGRQFEADAVEVVEPAGSEAIERYLASGVVPGVGPVLARRLVERFGPRTLDVIEESPRRLMEVDGVGRQKARRIHRALKEQRHTREVFLFLQGHGVGPALAARIHKTYGDRTVARVQEDPYQLIYDVRGVGFLTADRIARSLGIPVDSPQRARALIRHRLQEATLAGHTFLPRDQLQREVVQEGVPPERFEEALATASGRGEVVIDSGGVPPEAVYLPYLYEAELETCRRLRLLLSSETASGSSSQPAARAPEASGKLKVDRRASREDEVAVAERSSGLHLSEEQRQALRLALEQPVSIITGGPGTGKTTLARAVAAWCQAQGLRLLLASPTGRAARRLHEATGLPARTLHRTLEFAYLPGVGGRFQRNENRPLEADVVLVDELSMVDLSLFARLLSAVVPPTRLILMGDADQLPSVGPGQVLRDLLESGVVPGVRLKQIFRQAAQSLIVQNAHRIRQGQLPLWNKRDGEFFFIQAEPERVPTLVTDLVSRRLPGFSPELAPGQIQVLCATRKGPNGADALNRSLQEALNPPRQGMAEVMGGGADGEPERFRVGDRVMQVRNNYEKMVFNGELGRVTALDPEHGTVVVSFEEGEESQEVSYGSGDLDELQLAYATSVHKSQGSEYPAVVMPVVWVMPSLMSRNLLYTAITRARRLVVLVGQLDALERYCRSKGALLDRNSRLPARLAEFFGQGVAVGPDGSVQTPRSPAPPVERLRPALEAFWQERRVPLPMDRFWTDPEQQRPSTLCYVERDGRYLMIRRLKEPFAGLWTAPGGKVEPGESPEEAIRREIREETGLELERVELRLVTSEQGPLPAYNWLLFLFRGTAAPGPVREGGEGRLGWFTPQDLQQAPIPEVDRRLLPHVLAGAGAPLVLAWVRYDATGGVVDLRVEPGGRKGPAAGERRG